VPWYSSSTFIAYFRIDKKCVKLRFPWPINTADRMLITEEVDYGRTAILCNRFLRAVHNDVLGQNLTFFTNEAWFHLSGCITAQSKQ
jgi:hypothetical protein